MKTKLTEYIPALDGLRAISIILVYLSHVVYYSEITKSAVFPGGFGVTIFFFISGFLITRLLMEEIKTAGQINLKTFYIRRVLRLYPPLLGMLLCITLFLVLARNLFPFSELLAALFYYENYYTVFISPNANYYGILWSLAVEEHFYFFYPLLLLIFGKKPKILLWLIPLLMVIPLIVRCYIATKFHTNIFSSSYTYSLSHDRYDSILFGCLSALFLDSKYKEVYLRITTNKIIFSAGLGMILFSLLFRSEFFRQTFRYTVQGIGLFILIPPILYSVGYSFINKILSNRSMVFIGKLSYSFYLYHFVLLTIMLWYKAPNPFWYIIINFPASVGLTLLSYYYIEQPFFRLRKKFGSRIQEEVLPAPATQLA